MEKQIVVFRNTITPQVVKEWYRSVQVNFNGNDIDLASFRPFPDYGEYYGEILDEIGRETKKGLEFYLRMIKQSSKYTL